MTTLSKSKSNRNNLQVHCVTIIIKRPHKYTVCFHLEFVIIKEYYGFMHKFVIKYLYANFRFTLHFILEENLIK